MDSVSGVGVLDKAMSVLGSVETLPASLAELVERTGLPRPTAHRLAVALEAHGLLRRDADGRFALGLRLIGLGHAAADSVPVALAARPALVWLHEQTGESVQLFVRDGDVRVCVDSIESARELRTIVPIGARLPLDAGSAGRILSAGGREPIGGTRSRTLTQRRSRVAASWVQSVAEREEGVASVSAPVQDATGRVLASVSVSGPIQRLSSKPGAKYGEVVVEAALRVESAIRSG